MEDGPPMFRQDFTCPALLDFIVDRFSHTGLSPAMAGLSSPFCYPHHDLRAVPRSLVATQGISVDFFSSGYLDISVPQVRFVHLCIQCTMTPKSRVSPFGNLRIKVSLPTPRSLSQATTSFLASCRQGIHHVRLVA